MYIRRWCSFFSVFFSFSCVSFAMPLKLVGNVSASCSLWQSKTVLLYLLFAIPSVVGLVMEDLSIFLFVRLKICHIGYESNQRTDIKFCSGTWSMEMVNVLICLRILKWNLSLLIHGSVFPPLIYFRHATCLFVICNLRILMRNVLQKFDKFLLMTADDSCTHC